MAVDASICLPLALLSSDDFCALNAEQQQSFAARLRHCLEIAESGLEAAKEQDSTLLDAIDDIELDALSIMSAFSDTKTAVSPYIVHSSWTFECDRQAMSAHVGAEATEFLGAASLQLSASYSDVRSWLQRWARVLQAVLGRFAAARSFTEAITQLIVIDALVAAYLAFAATVRLNARIS
jgi:hypothetical protein